VPETALLIPLDTGLDTVMALLKARADLLTTVALLRTAGELEKAAALAAQVGHLTTIATETLIHLCPLTTPGHRRMRQLSGLLTL
jgi:hypothetical protein